jgi:3-hydroxybutyrate dehydrogenase
MMFEGKRVLVTGGGSGVGADLALGFADKNADVVICGRRAGPLENTAQKHQRIRPYLCDITNESSVIDLFTQNGSFDIVIANAGQADSAPFVKTSLDQWNAMLAVNLTGVFLVFREGLRHMKDWGRLISVCSTAGVKGYAKVAPYTACTGS